MLRRKFWDYIAWVVLFLIALWLVLKLTGVINTPLLLEYSPLFGAVYLVGWGMNKLDSMDRNADEIKDDVKGLERDFKEVESDMGVLRKNCPEL